MNRMTLFGLSLGLLGLAAWPLSGLVRADEPAPVDLGRALALAEQASPSLKAALARENASREAVRGSRSAYLPTLDAAAVDSDGFPGSAPGLDGFDGLVASPYRKGMAADAFSKWNLVDASAWYDVSAAQYAAGASHEAAQIEREAVDQEALKVYLEAVLYRGYGQAWADLVGALGGVRDTVRRFVRNGQYSEVQGLLIEDQLDDADLKQQDYILRYRTVLLRLGLLTGLDGSTITCPAPADLDEASLAAIQEPGGDSPLLLRAADEAKAAGETTKSFSSENLPKVELGGSVGTLEGERLVQGQDYSAFAGITLPLFEGFKIDAGERQARQEEAAKDQELIEARLALDDLNARLDDQIAEARNDLKRLLPETDRAARAVSLSRSRYLTFLGPLSDLQQALKDRVNVESQIAEVKTQLLLALGSKALVNGGVLATDR